MTTSMRETIGDYAYQQGADGYNDFFEWAESPILREYVLAENDWCEWYRQAWAESEMQYFVDGPQNIVRVGRQRCFDVADHRNAVTV